MKNLLLILMLLTTCCLTAQNILHVNPAQGSDSPDHYSSIQEAVDNATSGDFIYVYPGTYASAIVDKQLRIVGQGYQVSVNYPEANIAFANAYVNGQLKITGTAEGTVIEGLQIKTLFIDNANDCRVSRNQIDGMFVKGATFTRVNQNYFNDVGVARTEVFACATTSTTKAQLYVVGGGAVVVENNIFKGPTSSLSSILFSDCGDGITNSAQVVNNYFENRISFSSASIYFANNMTNFLARFFNATGSVVFTNNVLYAPTGHTFPNSPGNYRSTDPLSTEFVSNTGTFSFDQGFQLAPTAFSRGFATDGGDCGPYGGVTPYIPSGVPALPFIYDFIVPEEGTTGDGINVTVKVRTQN